MSADERVSDAWEAARAAWPGIDVPLAAFVAFLAGREVDETTADLYLACACLRGDGAALATFDRVFLSHVAEWVRSIDASPAFADEVAQLVRGKLFLGEQPKLGDYEGRSSLLSWLRVVAVRSALNLRRDRLREREQSLDDDMLSLATDADAELELIKSRYREEFEDAIRAALTALPEEERRVLRLHLCGRLTTTQIGAVLRIHQSNVSRRLARARELLRQDVRERLAARLGLDTAAFESLAPLLLSRLDVSVGACLQSIERE